MLEIDVTDTSVTIDQLLNEVEHGNEITITRHGQPIARLSPVSPLRRPLTSRGQLRATQPQASTSSLETLQSLRQEA